MKSIIQIARQRIWWILLALVIVGVLFFRPSIFGFKEGMNTAAKKPAGKGKGRGSGSGRGAGTGSGKGKGTGTGTGTGKAKGKGKGKGTGRGKGKGRGAGTGSGRGRGSKQPVNNVGALSQDNVPLETETYMPTLNSSKSE
jgi:hypothetical protein